MPSKTKRRKRPFAIHKVLLLVLLVGNGLLALFTRHRGGAPRWNRSRQVARFGDHPNGMH